MCSPEGKRGPKELKIPRKVLLDLLMDHATLVAELEKVNIHVKV